MALPLGLQALVVARLGVEMLIWDEFYYVDFIRALREGSGWLPWLWRQHNEHRVLPMKLVMGPLALLTGWSTVAEMYVSVGLAAVIVLALLAIWRRGGEERSLLVFAPVAWLVCSLGQYQNMLYGMQMCYYLTVAGVAWAVALLARRTRLALAGAVVCAFLASYSTVNGFLVWPAGLAMLLLWRERAARTAAWVAAGAGCVLLYLVDFMRPANTPAIQLGARGLTAIGDFTLCLIGQPLAAGSFAWYPVLGLAVLGLAAWLGWRRLGRGRSAADVPLAGLVLFGLLSAGVVAVGRAAFGIQALESRYIAYTSLAIAGLYLLAARAGRADSPSLARSPLYVASTVVLLLGLAATNLHGFRGATQWRADRLRAQYLLQTWQSQPDAELAGLYFVNEVRRMAPYLEAEHLGPFRHPLDLLLLIRWREGVAAQEILPDRPVEQRLVCPVETLRDLGVLFAAYARHNRSTVEVTLSQGDRLLVRRTVSAELIGDAGWLWVRLPEPLADCRGRALTLRVASPNAKPGNAVTVWTFPQYYEGDLTQPGDPAIAGRSLGLELNAWTSGAAM